MQKTQGNSEVRRMCATAASVASRATSSNEVRRVEGQEEAGGTEGGDRGEKMREGDGEGEREKETEGDCALQTCPRDASVERERSEAAGGGKEEGVGGLEKGMGGRGVDTCHRSAA